VASLPDAGFIELGDTRLEYRLWGPPPDAAPTLVLLHEALGCAGGWGEFPRRLAAATGCAIFAYSRAG
jgi:pimeloyl-ACP methyl ester carboxylesterase